MNGRITPAWRIAGGSAHQDAFVTSATTAAREGAQVAQVPHHPLSLWNHYQFRPRVAAVVGVLYRTDVFAADKTYYINADSNTNISPGYRRALA